MDKLLGNPLLMEALGDIPSLVQRYASGELTPGKVVQAIHARIQDDPDHIWIYKLPLNVLKDYALKLEARARDRQLCRYMVFHSPSRIILIWQVYLPQWLVRRLPMCRSVAQPWYRD